MSRTPPLRVLVTGASGFVGRHTARALRAAGHSVSALVHGSPLVASDEEESGSAIRILKGSILDPAAMARALTDIDVVVHLAAIMDFFPPGVDGVKHMFRVNVDGTATLAQAAIAAGVKRFIYVSSTEAHGPSPKSGAPATETTPSEPSYAYGSSKVLAEFRLAQVCRGKLDYIILRPSGIFGPEDDFAIREMLGMVHSGLLCFVPGSGACSLMFTYIDDVTQAINCAVKQDLPKQALNQTYFIAPDKALTYKQWIELCCKLLNRPAPFFHIPVPIAAVVTALLAPAMNRGKRRIFMFQADTVRIAMQQNRVYSNEKAKSLLGYRPQYTIEAALQRTVGWYRAHGQLRRTALDPVSPVLLGLVIALLLAAFVAFALKKL